MPRVFFSKTQDEIDEQLSTIRQLEIAIDAKDGPLKLAETRLENRQNRPMQELCTDLPLEGLIDEVQTIKESIVKLEDKLDNAK